MPRYFDLDVTLVLPRRVWRRFLIHKAATFAELHQAIQAAFGWEDRHLFEFRRPGLREMAIAGLPDADDGFTDRHVPDARRRHLRDYFTSILAPAWCEYVYDFGDGWVHEVKLREEVSLKETFKRRLLEGELAAPLEDCGGTGGYERMVAVVETGRDPWDETEEVKAWLGPWRPEVFDREAVRASFDVVRGPTRRRPPARPEPH